MQKRTDLVNILVFKSISKNFSKNFFYCRFSFFDSKFTDCEKYKIYSISTTLGSP
jgi:hypothetical protein